MKTKATKRSRGYVKALVVELDVAQYENLEKICKELGISKTRAVATALNVWFNMIRSK